MHLVGQQENWLKEEFKRSFYGPPGRVRKEVAGEARCSLVATRVIRACELVVDHVQEAPRCEASITES